MRREDAGINSPMGDGKQFDFQRGESPDADAERKLARMTTTHKVANPRKKEASQGWCACFSICFGGGQEEDQTDVEDGPSTQAAANKADPPAPSFMTQVDRPDTTPTRNTQPDSRAGKGQAGATQEDTRSGLQSPRKEETMGSSPQQLEMTDNRPARGAAAGTSGKPAGNEIELYAFKDPNSKEIDPKGLLQPNVTKFKKTLVLDLDETLVHSSFRPVDNPTFIIPVHIDNHVYNVYVLKRPYTDIFLERAAKCYEIIIFTASLAKYADPLLDELDKKKVINGRLFRNSCVMSGKTYVKDLSVLGRQLKNTIIVDNSPLSYQFQPKCAINCTSWFDDPEDTELLDMLPLLETTLLENDDVRDVLDADTITYPELMTKATRDTNTGREPMWGFSDGTGC